MLVFIEFALLSVEFCFRRGGPYIYMRKYY